MSKFFKKALFLDRDGVLNYLVSNRPPWSLSEIKIYDEAFEIISLAKQKSYIPIVITNQPDAGRGKLGFDDLENINNHIMRILGINHSYICMHPYDGMCNCRKPKIGSFLNAKQKHKINLEKSILIGDRDKDIIAGNNANCTTIKISNSSSPLANYNVSNHNELINLIKKLLID